MKKALSIILSLCIAAAILFVAVSCGKITCEYDENGNVTKESYYDAGGKLRSYSVYEYDENGNKTKESIYDADGKLECVCEFDENGKKTKSSGYDAEGNLIYSK